jgi:hypothetical protein
MHVVTTSISCLPDWCHRDARLTTHAPYVSTNMYWCVCLAWELLGT